MNDEKQKGVRVGRLGRLARLGGMATRLAGDAVVAVGGLTGGTQRAQRVLHRRAAATLEKAFSELKGLPMKVGQILSYVDDVIPEEHREIYRETLKKLQTRVRPVEWERMREVLKEDLGRSVSETFASFDEEPLAAASIGQVYAATTPEGQEVVVKIQYPGIAAAVRNDLKNIDTVLSALSAVLPRVEVEQTVSDVKSRLSEECDYRIERQHQQRFAKIWSGHAVVHVPRAIDALCTERVLVSERVFGRGFHEMLEDTDQAERDRVGRAIYDFVFRSLYVHGLFNADPHPGNYLFEPDGRIAFLDYGCVQAFDAETLEKLTRTRHLIVAGIRGPELRAALKHTMDLPDIIDHDLWPYAEAYFLATYRALLAPQPYRFGRDHTKGLTDLTMRAKLKYLPKALRSGVQEMKIPGLVFLNRINFGLMSILGALGAEGDWLATMESIDGEAAAQAAG